MDAPSLHRCVGDVDLFLGIHWAKAPFLHRAGGSSFDDLASLDDLDRMVSSLGLRSSSLRMVKDGATLAPASYTTTPGARSRGVEGIVNPALVYEQFHEGATIALEGLHRYWEPLTDFCRDLELTLGHRLQVNAYITPPGSQGFEVHRDDHDVFVLQISGSKHWLVYDGDDGERVLVDETIERGDSLYIPKGFPHTATTGESASSHLTVGILTHDSIDIVREIAKLAGEEPAFKERLESARSYDSLREAVEHHLDEFRRWVDKIDIDELTERVARRVLSTAQPILRGQLTQLELLASIDDGTQVMRRPGSICVVTPKGQGIRVLLVDRELDMPSAAADAVAFIGESDGFVVGELHRFLDPESSLVLVRRLVREGLLEVAVGR